MKQQNNIDFSIPLIALLVILIMAMSSCAANGYGCHGRSKIITRVR